MLIKGFHKILWRAGIFKLKWYTFCLKYNIVTMFSIEIHPGPLQKQAKVFIHRNLPKYYAICFISMLFQGCQFPKKTKFSFPICSLVGWIFSSQNLGCLFSWNLARPAVNEKEGTRLWHHLTWSMADTCRQKMLDPRKKPPARCIWKWQ